MVNKYKNFSYLILSTLVLLYSCDYILPDPAKDLNRIDSNSEFNIEVNTFRPQNGLIINNKYYYSSAQFLQKENNVPSWVLEEYVSDYGIDLYDSNGSILLDIWKIKTPFVIYKKRQSNILHLVKHSDTLQFIIYQ